jgi:AAA domain, putative AbiEii toxin, Type IV TA system
MKLYLENVRSFDGWHEIPIAPATVLLGENSAGKSTLLGMLAVVHQEGFPFTGNFFNQFPFEFGGYKTLASNRKSATHFSVGFETLGYDNRSEKDNVSVGLIAAFKDSDGLPELCHVMAWIGDFGLNFYEAGFENLDRLKQRDFSNIFELATFSLPVIKLQGNSLHSMFRAAYVERMKVEKSERKNMEWADKFGYVLAQLQAGWNEPAMSFAPMRSRPKRTYDQLNDAFSPEGDHVPLMLARATDPNNKQAASLHSAIQSFGKYSEMFSDIGVKQLGRGSGDPFQVQVKVGSKQTNIMDVGYGVSQVLPLIVDAHRASPNTTLLLQQPEVHLHPKAQAALGSMIKDWVSKGKKTVVVETHSDYLVDRLRLEVKRGNLKGNAVQIFFLEKKGNQTKLHVLEIDSQGNVLNAPDGYRDFFLREQMALLVD